MDIHVDVLTPDAHTALLRSFYSDRPARFDSVVFRAEAGGETVGSARVGPPPDLFGPWVGQLHELTVASAHRGRGVGGRLHDVCLAAWRAAGVTVGVLEVATAAEQDFYESRGWALDGHTRRTFDDRTFLRLRRTIN